MFDRAFGRVSVWLFAGRCTLPLGSRDPILAIATFEARRTLGSSVCGTFARGASWLRTGGLAHMVCRCPGERGTAERAGRARLVVVHAEASRGARQTLMVRRAVRATSKT